MVQQKKRINPTLFNSIARVGEKRGGYGIEWVGISAQVARCKKKEGVGAVAFGLARSVGGSERKRRLSVWLKKEGWLFAFAE